MSPPFFWLHIKKSAGLTTRKLLQPYYTEVDRTKRPRNFIQSAPEQWNDILNNYRVVLGEYQFKRALFAKQFLYPDEWDRIVSFAFCRNPIDRCVSMFHYLYWRNGSVLRRELKNAVLHASGALGLSKRSAGVTRISYNASYAFSAFLDLVSRTRESDSIYQPAGLHFATHTAPMWDDITDFDGNIVLNRVYRLEHLVTGINEVFEVCGLQKRVNDDGLRLHKGKKRKSFSPRAHHVRHIEQIYAHDLELYESLS